MKLSDYVMNFLAEKGVTHVFGVSGGAAAHLFDSAGRHPSITPIFNTHEQASAMAADGYARVTGKLGVAISTSGPGATNLLTGCACSYYDSIPTMMITGQVATNRLRDEIPVRQLGFQETDTISIFRSVTKYAYQVRRPEMIRFALEKCYYEAFSGRPGPVLIDIPDDLQRFEVDPETMVSFKRMPPVMVPELADILSIVWHLSTAQKPIIILGGGLKTPAVSKHELRVLLERLNVPVLTTYAALDMIPHDHPLWVGQFGVYGPRIGNLFLQDSDFILCLGTRLSQNMTGANLASFAPKAKIAMVDIDGAEMSKFDGRDMVISLKVKAALSEFIRACHPYAFTNRSSPQWAINSPNKEPEPSGFFAALSKEIPDGETIFVDTGATLVWACNNLKLKRYQQLFSAWNNTPMGYALPAAIGACIKDRKPVTCIIGDGGLLMCLAELATVERHKLPIRIIIINNAGHAIQRQTLRTWLGGRQTGTDWASGLALPSFRQLSEAMNIQCTVINTERKEVMGPMLRAVYGAHPQPYVLDVRIDPAQGLIPFLKAGDPLDRQQPYAAT